MSKKKLILIAFVIPIVLIIAAVSVYATTKYISENDFYTANDIFCISKSQEFKEGNYTEHSKFIVGNSTKERALAYAILSRTEDKSNNETSYRNKIDQKGDSAQWAVWKLIGNGSSFSYFKDYELSQDNSNGSITYDMYHHNQTWRYAIYDRAMAYANYKGVNAPANISISEKTSDNKVKINLGNYNTSSSYKDETPSKYGHKNTTVTLDNLGGVKSVTLTIDGVSTTYTGNDLKRHLDSDSSGRYYFIISNATNIGILNVEVKYYEVKYNAEGNVLTKASSQTLISAQGTKNEEVVATRTATKVFETDVSLQKYITKVNGNDLTNNETTLTNRKNTYSSTSEGNEEAKKVVAKNEKRNMQSNTYKRSNVVNIEAGDTVTYRIHVYNNSNVEAKAVEIRDRLLYFNTKSQYTDYDIMSITKNGQSTDIKSEWKYVDGTLPHEYTYTINNFAAGAETYFDITVKLNTYLADTVIGNTAYINNTNPKNKHTYRTVDRDYIKMKPYKVSLQKIVHSVNGSQTVQSTYGNNNILKDSNTNQRWESWESTANKNKTPANELYNRDNLYAKHNNPVVVSNGDTVTYAVRVRNDYDTKVKITKITDTLPTGVSLQNVTNENGNKVSYTVNGQQITINETTRLLNKNETQTYYVTVKVTESNMSTKLLRNYAYINGLENKNGKDVTDSTSANNDDADYIQLKDITIAGTVWNDKALDKKQDNYNGQYDSEQENKLSGIKVQLYREGKGIIETTTTDENGNYSFDASKIDSKAVTEQCERHIKAPYTCTSDYTGDVKHGANYWKENAYYSYYIVFEYDGVTYTSTIMGDINASNYTNNSNAKEDNGLVKETRKSFNDRFSTINNQSGINYTTKNEEGYLPQSNHVYNETTMAMQSSTNLVNIGSVTEDQLQHINLGLRGRDIFDLRLDSDVYSTKVSVNGQEGLYNYNSNKVTVRKSDIGVAEDAANFANETKEVTVGEVGQTIRTTDLDVNVANSRATNKYASTGLGIEVTYKITITNESPTVGTASKVIDYYDGRYTFKEAYGDVSSYEDKGINGKYSSVMITTNAKKISQSNNNVMEIYVVYQLNEPTNTLNSLLQGTQLIPTYNMAEVYEYKTYTTNNNEATRGLLDKDSAPGSANTEKARLVNGTSKDTTVQYYFKAKDLSNLKYEDDTYAAPTLYFTKNNNGRKLSGKVFEDSTKVNKDKVRTGDGIKSDSEKSVDKVTVQLLEKTKSKEYDYEDNQGKHYVIRYSTSTNPNGDYEFTNFLPGNYIVHYNYGDIHETFLYGNDLNNNKKSYNGEDFQATNNTGTHGAETLNGTSNYWYAYNESKGISTGTDNVARRKKVSETVVDFNDNQMTVLNKAKSGTQENNDDAKEIAKLTYMYADTPIMNLTVEKTVLNKEGTHQENTSFSSYHVENMNFGIAEVPVTTIDLQKHVSGFTIKDSAGDNTIASLKKQEDGTWKTIGNIQPIEKKEQKGYDISIEDEKLQGAKLEVTYDITSNITVEKNFDNTGGVEATVTGLVDYIDNDLSYNETLGNNSTYWEVTDYPSVKGSYTAQSKYINSKGEEVTEDRSGVLDPEGTKYTTIVKAKTGNPLLSKTGGTAQITLEKVLSAEEVTIGNIITSSINTYEYDNAVEITGIKYENTTTDSTDKFTFRDRVRTPEKQDPTESRMIILAGRQYDNAISETIVIHPPTGENNNIMYYIVAVISLGILATGIVLVKKYAIKK